MTTKPQKITPTRFNVRVTNNLSSQIEMPISGSGHLQPGASAEFSNVRANQLKSLRNNRHLALEILSDNSDELAAAEDRRQQVIANARDRVEALTRTLDERRAEEREIQDRLTALEAEERGSRDKDLAALREAGRSRQETAAGVLTSSGATDEERRGLEFDLWGATLRRLEVEAEQADAASVVAADDEVRRQAEIREAERGVEWAQEHLAAVRRDQDRTFSRPDIIKKRAKDLRIEAAELEKSGPTPRPNTSAA